MLTLSHSTSTHTHWTPNSLGPLSVTPLTAIPWSSVVINKKLRTYLYILSESLYDIAGTADYTHPKSFLIYHEHSSLCLFWERCREEHSWFWFFSKGTTGPFLCLKYWFPIFFSSFFAIFLLHSCILFQASANPDLFLESGGCYAIANLLPELGQYSHIPTRIPHTQTTSNTTHKNKSC